MKPTDFPEANITFGPPSDMHEAQVASIRAFRGVATGGSVDGVDVVVTAWKPTQEEIADIVTGSPVFLSFVGGLPPHFVTTRFEQAINPE